MRIAPRKILAIKFRAMGDTVLMTAPLAELRQAYPEAEIHAAILAPWAPLLEGHPAVNKVWRYEKHADRVARARALARLAFRLRRERFDWVVCFHASPSSATLAFATGSKIRSIHFHGHRDKNRYSTVDVPGKGILKPIIERDMDAIRALGIHAPPGRMPTLSVQESAQRQAAERLERQGLPSPVLGLGLGASRPTKHWPVERFAQLAIAWCRSSPGSALALVGPGEEEVIHAFLKQVDDALTVTVPDSAERAAIRARISTEHKLGVAQLPALLGRMAVFAGNDSGLRHLAVAAGTPTVTIFGPEHPFEWHPYAAESHPFFFVESLPCRRDADPGMPAWCGIAECGELTEERHQCMLLIGVDPVLETCRKLAGVA